MKVPFHWLSDLFQGKLGDVSPEEVAYHLTRHGFGVDQILRLDKGLEQVVVGRLIEVSKHPNADRLTVCKVEVAPGQVRSIVCGAKNHKKGDFVAVALPGAQLPNGLFIKESQLRGVLSQGMLCSREELGMVVPGETKDEDEGIILLPSTSVVGAPVARALGRDDVVFDVEVTSNRADGLGIIGIARELAAGLRRSFTVPKAALKTNEQTRAEQVVSIKIAAEKECPYFSLQVIRGVSVKPSPEWLRVRLEAAGMRSVNNIVDATNYIMLETGQPLHAYDLSQVEDGALVVRRAKAGQPFKALDGTDWKLSTQDLVISDEKQVLCLAGVFGGEKSGVSESTKDIALEAAYFDPATVRATAKRYALKTESSHRFERGVDPEGIDTASSRAAELIIKLAGGSVLGGIVRAGKTPGRRRPMNVDLRRYKRLIGMSITQAEAVELLRRLDIQVEPKSQNVLKVTPPSFRGDLTREVDIIEELARLQGYDQVPTTMPQAHTGDWTDTGARWGWIQDLKDDVLRCGFSEAVTYSFAPATLSEPFRSPFLAYAAMVPLRNPLSEELAVLRPSGVVGLLQSLSRNQRMGLMNIALFEQATLYGALKTEAYPQTFREPALVRPDKRGVREVAGLTFLQSGKNVGEESSSLWNAQARDMDFFDLKGKLDALLSVSLKLKAEWQIPEKLIPFLHPGIQAEIVVHRELIGWAGQLHPDLHALFGLKDTPVWIAECNVDKVKDVLLRQRFKFELPPPFPKVERDAAFLVNKELPVSRLLQVLKKVKNPLYRDVIIFDVFEGQGIAAERKSVGLRFSFQATEKTLTDEEINAAFHQCIEVIRTECKAELRGTI